MSQRYPVFLSVFHIKFLLQVAQGRHVYRCAMDFGVNIRKYPHHTRSRFQEVNLAESLCSPAQAAGFEPRSRCNRAVEVEAGINSFNMFPCLSTLQHQPSMYSGPICAISNSWLVSAVIFLSRSELERKPETHGISLVARLGPKFTASRGFSATQPVAV